MRRWFRVLSPGHFLDGCDVLADESDSEGYCQITGVRRIDILQGSQPYQTRGDFQLKIKKSLLIDSPYQDDTLVLAYDPPFGKATEELFERTSVRDSSGNTHRIHLDIVFFKQAVQIAVSDSRSGPSSDALITPVSVLAELNEQNSAFIRMLPLEFCNIEEIDQLDSFVSRILSLKKTHE